MSARNAGTRLIAASAERQSKSCQWARRARSASTSIPSVHPVPWITGGMRAREMRFFRSSSTSAAIAIVNGRASKAVERWFILDVLYMQYEDTQFKGRDSRESHATRLPPGPDGYDQQPAIRREV